MSSSNLSPPSGRNACIVPNRIFVGGISVSTTESELCTLFEGFGNIKATKIIYDRNGLSKGYGFITYETEEEALRVIREADGITLRDRKLNVRRAVKKHSSNDALFLAGDMSGGRAYATSRRVWQASYPVMLHQPVFVPQYQYPAASAASGGTPYPYYALAQVNASDFYNCALPDSAEYAASDSSRLSSDYNQTTNGVGRAKASCPIQTSGSDIDSLSSASKSNPASPSTSYRYASSGVASVSPRSPYLPQLPHKPHSVALMAYPGSIVVGTPNMFQVGESNDQDVIPEFVYNSPMQMATGSLTPPPTPLYDLGTMSMDTARKN